MCFHPYVLERIVTHRLEELRAEAAQRMSWASTKRDRPGVATMVRAVITRAGRIVGLRGAVRPRHA